MTMLKDVEDLKASLKEKTIPDIKAYIQTNFPDLSEAIPSKKADVIELAVKCHNQKRTQEYEELTKQWQD
eukprot:9698459-Karenia_brevis.AAC.1